MECTVRAGHKLIAILVAALFTVGSSGGAAAGGGHGSPGIIPPDAHYRGLSYSEWGVRWWQALFSIPVVDSHHPFFDGGAFGDDEDVTFLSGVASGATIHIKIERGTALFFPVLNVECSVIEEDPFHGDNPAELRRCAKGFIDHVLSAFAVIDGTPVEDLDDFRVKPRLFKFGPLPKNNLLGAPAGAASQSVHAGIYLLLAPLSLGRHTIHFGGAVSGSAADFSIDTTYIVTVVRELD